MISIISVLIRFSLNTLQANTKLNYITPCTVSETMILPTCIIKHINIYYLFTINHYEYVQTLYETVIYNHCLLIWMFFAGLTKNFNILTPNCRKGGKVTRRIIQWKHVYPLCCDITNLKVPQILCPLSFASFWRALKNLHHPLSRLLLVHCLHWFLSCLLGFLWVMKFSK